MGSRPPGWSGEFVTARQAADFLRVHIRTVQRYARDGILPSFRIGRRLRFRREDVEAILVDDDDPTNARPPPPKD